ncbi:flagellar hook-basal body protein [Aliibacillus thermotolerans]|uniref:Flagellar hook-basal body protein n=1 Tax=Aliibacillus thermotolerans TaxID=1834418 RepID=A0ABW0UAQ3_9BACI|nr:flagellar hook-basal body protein [Aliibacillus thermotolerans]MDA3128748.1 flagellar hook-basal body complex protein [Aliibacillus thermotolerans]
MYQSMLSSANTMNQIQHKLDSISHNLANSNRTGYKSRETTFSDLLFQEVNNQWYPENQAGRLSPNGLRVGTGAKVAQTALRLDQGAVHQTGRALDFAITEEDYFFQVEGPDGDIRYSRDGAFYLTEDPDNPGGWTLVNSHGEFLIGAEERFDIPAGARDFTLLADGTLQATLPNGEDVIVGEFELVRITKPQLLEALEGGNSFRFPDLAELGLAEADVLEYVEADDRLVMQEALEQSNVDLTKEMTDMLEAQRHYALQARALSQGDQMMGLINSVRS